MQYKVFNLDDPNIFLQTDVLSRRFAETITSPFNDQVTILINGTRGSGKSFLGLDIAIKTAQEIAKIKGGNPSKYFSLNNVAIIKLDSVLDLMENLQQYGIYFLDDIGVGYSNREWRSQKNIRMNKIVQTFRTDNVMTIYSVPDKNLIDKVPREMVEKYIETHKDNNMYSMGINIAKVFNLEKLLRDDKLLTIPQVVERQNEMYQYSRYVSHKPPDSIIEQYNSARKKIAQDLRKEETQAIRNGEIKDEVQKITKKQRILELDRDWKANVDDCQTQYKTKKEYLKQNGFYNYSSVMSTLQRAKEGGNN